MTNNEVRKLTVRVEADLYKELQKYAIDNDTSIQALVVGYVKDLVGGELDARRKNI